MGVYGGFAVWPVSDKQPVWADGAESRLVTRVSPSMRLKVLRREDAHYLVRLPDLRQGYVRVDAVSAGQASPASELLRREAPKHTGVQADFVPASYFARIMARIVDTIAFWIALTVVIVAAGAGGASDPADASETAGGAAFAGTSNTVIWVSLFAVWGVGFLYEWIGTAAGGTIGKSKLGISVIDAATGRAPGLGRSFARYASQFVVNIVASTGMIWAADGGQLTLGLAFFALYYAPYLVAFANDGRTAYDVIAGTWVVQYR
jgi:uncharacterized RDD family membrane protein YckC